MAYSNLNIEKIPAINKIFRQKSSNFSYDQKHVIEAHKKMIQDVDNKYGRIIEKWQDVFQIDKGVIISFICTESGGKNAPKNRFNATGLMQVTPNTVYEVITKWGSQVKVPLSAETKTFLNSKVSTTSKWSASRVPTSAEKSQILSALTNEEYNIAVGTATIRWMLESFKKMGSGGLDKVMIAYNAGYYGTRNIIKNQTIEQIESNTKLQPESRAYIVKMLGVYGFMDLYYNVLNK
jgi:soluble lytic murein transglycosylase-like protein